MLAKTAPFAAELEQAFPERPFRVLFWDGTEVPATSQNGGPTFQINSPKALAHILRAPGELGLGRAYIQGLLDVDDLDAAIHVVDTWRPPGRSRLASRRAYRSIRSSPTCSTIPMLAIASNGSPEISR